ASMPRLHEWRFDMLTGSVSEQYLDDVGSEFPRVAARDAGLPARYGFSMGLGFIGGEPQILKYDLDRGAEKSVHTFPQGHTPGEPTFVPASDATQGDDGWVTTFVHDAGTDTSYMVILDATDMAADPVAEVQLPRRIPTGFHGSWIPDPA
ncbi:MAG: carotenoid oxygenase family protein, partial [Actinomycetota bacterium]|nr:carotenoid oxygenase family protein [Actinomycetota bacterium]